MKISAQNSLEGKIVQITKELTNAFVQIDVNGTIITAFISNNALGELGLKIGDMVTAVIKASDVMVAID